MDAREDLSGPWFDEGDALATEEQFEEAPRPNLLGRFGLALAGAGVFVTALVTVARALA
jgi:hypothetical protein